MYIYGVQFGKKWGSLAREENLFAFEDNCKTYMIGIDTGEGTFEDMKKWGEKIKKCILGGNGLSWRKLDWTKFFPNYSWAPWWDSGSLAISKLQVESMTTGIFDNGKKI